MAVDIYYEKDVDPSVIQGKKVAIIGYRHHRLRLAGPRPRAEPSGLRR